MLNDEILNTLKINELISGDMLVIRKKKILKLIPKGKLEEVFGLNISIAIYLNKNSKIHLMIPFDQKSTKQYTKDTHIKHIFTLPKGIDQYLKLKYL